jgi:uncharacterized protein
MNWMSRVLLAWVGLVSRRPQLTLTVLILFTGWMAWIAVTQFRINSDLSLLINQNAPWRMDFDHFEAQFPHLVRTAVIVVSGKSRKQVELATQKIVTYLNAKPDLFSEVAAPGAESFFRDHAFLYMDLDTLDDMADRLAEAQPWLTAVAEDPSLRGILRLVGEGIENDPPAGFANVLQLLGKSAEQVLAGADGTIWWSDELFKVQDTRYQLIYLKPKSSFGETLPDAQVMAELRAMVPALSLPEAVEVNITGELALQHEEIEAAISGVSTAGWLALALLLIVLIVGVRSLKIIVAMFTLLAIGVLWTSAFAMTAVGEYNTLSLVFVVMFFGLAVDFALHFSLRYQEAINRDDADFVGALKISTSSVGRAITLCTLTTAMGFLGFWPTDYQGLADLGVISAGGMVIAWFLTFTYLPAFYAVVGPPRAHTMDLPTSELVVNWLLGHRTWVVGAVTLSAAVGMYWASQASFDYSVLALKDPQAESMQTLRELQREGLSTDYQLVALSAQPLDKSAIEQLAVVDEVRTPQDWVPKDQEDKLFVVADIQQLLWSALNPRAAQTAPHPQALRERARDLLSRLDRALVTHGAGQQTSEQSLAQFRARLMAMVSASDEQWRSWQHAVVANLLDELAWLGRATEVDVIEFADLPDTVTSRLVAANAEQLTVILPAQDIADVDALSRFIQDVRELVPQATGRPVIEWGVGSIVVDSFLQALVFAFFSILLILVVALKRAHAVFMILLPLVLTAVYTLTVGVVLSMPINMANILVIPLIFGLGVDNGIHVVDRYLGEGNVNGLMHSSTPRAVLLSTLTTIGAFAALSISPHAGTASIGLLLTIAIGFLLLITIFLLPVLLTGQRKQP